MITLDFANTQQVVFEDPVLRNRLSDFKPLFDTWLLSIRVPALRQAGRRAVLDFLASANASHLAVIGDHLGEEVSITKLDYNIVKHIEVSSDSVANALNSIDGYGNIVVTRGESDVSVTLWR